MRSIPAWVLLGEPGAGKSKALKDEADACNGIYLSIAEFTSEEIDVTWKDHCLFLDGLDEVRGGGSNEAILIRVRSRLRRLGSPKFRIACRAADWYGQSDLEDIVRASPNEELHIYVLQPLERSDIRKILKINFDRTDADEFIEQAEQHGIGALLNNPQTLQMAVEALQGSGWPDSRDMTYHLACKAQVREGNKRHRDRERFNPIDTEDLLDAAGRLFASLLLSDKSGVSLDVLVRNDRFPTVNDLLPESPETVAAALDTKLFIQSNSSDERLEPSHRSVAEYLAARWLGEQIDQHGLPLQRVLNLMLGFDGKAVAGLRGLYGWLALHSQTARQWLIKNDPLTVALYSDPQSMDVASTRQLLHDLYIQIQGNPSILWELRGAENLGALFQEGIQDEYIAALQDPRRDDATQTFVVFVLKVLKQAALTANIASELRNAASDGSRWERVRRHALEAWLASAVTDADALEFLDQLDMATIPDSNEELAGILLNGLFPRAISGKEILRYFHLPKSEFLGTYLHFWAYTFPDAISATDLPNILDELSLREDLQPIDRVEFHISRMLAALVARSVQIHGDAISNEKLFSWLRIGADEYGEIRNQSEFQDSIAAWLAKRPERYKGLLGVCYDRNGDQESPLHALFNDTQVLRGVSSPAEIGLWHFQQIDSTKNETLAKEHLSSAIRALWSDQGNQGLTLEMVTDWAGDDEVKLCWLRPELCCPILDLQIAQNDAAKQRQYEQDQSKHDRSFNLSVKLPEIATGVAHPALLGELAGVWTNRYIDTRGDTPLDRFRSYCNNYEEVFNATSAGMKACVKRQDLPSVAEVIELSLQRREHFIRRACLLGMDLLWPETPSEIDSLSDATLEKMVCFRFTDATDATPAWFLHLVQKKPALVSKVLIAYASACFKAKRDFIDGISQLARDPEYKQVALLSVLELLRSLPSKINSSQLSHLSRLLKAGIKYAIPDLLNIIAQKLRLKSLEPSQKVYFLLAGALLDPSNYEQRLWSFVGNRWQRIEHISEFLGDGFNDLPIDLKLGAATLGKLIELQTPFAEVDWPMGGGIVSPAMRLGDHVKVLIGKLAALGTHESLEEIDRLVALPALIKIRRNLLSCKHESIQKLRENSFGFPPLSDVAVILANRAPTGPADLQAIVLEHLDQMAVDIRTSNSDLFRQFWNEGQELRHKTENSCRDALLAMLRSRLGSIGVDCNPEADSFNDKRTDIRVAYRNQIALPIEIKGEWHPDLWTSVQHQLIPQYTNASETKGYGVYLVLWIGGQEQPAARDGGKKPTTPKELEMRLAKQIPKEYQGRITVRVVDIGWPGGPARRTSSGMRRSN